MSNFNENPTELQGGKVKKDDDQRDIFEKEEQNKAIGSTAVEDFSEEIDFDSTKEEYIPISEKQAKQNEKFMLEDDYGSIVNNEKNENAEWFWYILFVNLGREGEKIVARIKATSQGQALYFFDNGISGIFYDQNGNVSKTKHSIYQKSHLVSVKKNPEPAEPPKRKKKNNK